MKLRLFGGHKTILPDRLSGETCGVARALARESWMGRRIAADIDGSADVASVAETTFIDSSRRIAVRMGAPSWLA
jgi:hypothetical protein